MNDYEWYCKNDLRKYSGKWVAIKNKKVIAAGEDLKVVLETASKKNMIFLK